MLEFEQLTSYLRNAHVNVLLEYQFSTKALPADFYEKAEWSKITLKYTNTNFEYLVEHDIRPTYFGHNSIELGTFNAAFKGVVSENLVTNGMVFSSLVDITNNVLIDEEVTLPIVDVDAKPNDVIHGVISGNDFIVVNRTSLVPDPEGTPEIIDIRYEGDRVDEIIWNIDNWNPQIPDSLLEIADPSSVSKVHNYVFEGFTSLDETYPFETVKYKTNTSYNRTTNLNAPLSNNFATVHFVMSVPEQDRVQAIKDYISHFQGNYFWFSDLSNDDSYLTALANKWLYFYERIEIKVGIHHNVTNFNFFNMNIDAQKSKNVKRYPS